MTVTFLCHSAFLVELNDCYLLFDWTGETPLPDMDRSKPLYVFASHHHSDHYTPKIFSLGMVNVTYILASCIRLSAKRKQQYEIAEQCVYRMKAGETRRIGDLTVRTVRSTDAGVAFLVDTGEKRLFHAGDLNHWHWEGEPDPWNPDMERAFRRSLRELEHTAVDAAFLPLDGRLEHAFFWGFHQFMETMDVGYAFPMHCWEDFSVIGKLRMMPESEPYRLRMAEITENGQVITL